MAHYQQNSLAVSIEEKAMAAALNETVDVDTTAAEKTSADMQTEALAADEHTTQSLAFYVSSVMSWTSQAGVVDAPAEIDGVNLLRNRDENAVLGPFDGRVAAHIWIASNRCFITTNARYVPSPSAGDPSEIVLRRDMRWGPDDPTLWPREYDDHFAHFAAIPRQPSTEKGRETLGIMWWNPDRTDFTSPESGMTVTRGLGELSRSKFHALSLLADELLAKCDNYAKSHSSSRSVLLMGELADCLRRGLVQLSSIPATFERMVIGVTNVQRAYLELAGVLQYMTVYVPRIENPAFRGGLPDADIMGAFTSNPTVAENFHRARLPFWFIRPLRSFTGENIFRVVEPLDPAHWLELDAVENFTPITVGSSVKERMRALHKATDALPWYKNPFASGDEAKPLVMRSSVAGSSSAVGLRAVEAGPSSQRKSRSSPYKRTDSMATKSNAQPERNKFEYFQNPYMAPAIPGWAAALAAVDRSQIPVCRVNPPNLYVFPEPALLIASESRLHMYLHHYQLVRDALCYRMGDPDDSQLPLSVSEWRDVLQGKVVKQGKLSSLSEKRTIAIEQVLGPAMKACGIQQLEGFPVSPDCTPHTPRIRGQEITWELAEMNFRYELCALDSRAAGLDRVAECMRCFPGALRSAPIFAVSCASHVGLVASSAPPITGDFPGSVDWTSEQILEFETQVARYYTQSFFHFFGRAANIPLRSP
ncbi:hypothetical protein B0H13DRAFT_2304233 [Mycena leptocephala]|nr:hypothetical protein B0H13DRAFT_2304233 [Mycena leptocephala]